MSSVLPNLVDSTEKPLRYHRGDNIVVFHYYQQYVSPGQVSKFPDLMEASHVDLTGNPGAACRYLTIAFTLGRLYVLWDERDTCCVLA